MHSDFKQYFLEALSQYSNFRVVAFSVVALFSIFTVHIAGFLLRVPSEFWSLVDTYFVSNLLIRFSLITALAALLARISPTILASAASFVTLIYVCLRYLPFPPGRRKLRAVGLKNLNKWIGRLPRETEREKKILLNWRDKRRHPAINQIYFGVITFDGGAYQKVERYLLAKKNSLHAIVIITVFLLFYINLLGGFLTALILVAMFYMASPNLFDVSAGSLSEMKEIIHLTKNRFFDFISIEKTVMLALIASACLGLFHHERLTGRAGLTGFGTSAEELSRIILVTSTGVLVHSDKQGYRFFTSQLATGGAVFGLPKRQ